MKKNIYCGSILYSPKSVRRRLKLNEMITEKTKTV